MTWSKNTSYCTFSTSHPNKLQNPSSIHTWMISSSTIPNPRLYLFNTLPSSTQHTFKLGHYLLMSMCQVLSSHQPYTYWCPHFCFLRSTKRFSMSPNTLTNVSRCTVQSIMTGCLTAWNNNSNTLECKEPQRVVNSACSIIGTFPSIKSIYVRCCLKKMAPIINPQLSWAMLASRCCHCAESTEA